MSPSSWDIAALAVKALLYAATLAATGGVFFLAYCASLIEARDHASIRRRVAVLTAVAIAASAVRILITAASMSGDASGMLDSGLVALAWQGAEGRAAMVRAAGFLFTVPALATSRRPAASAIAGAAAAATSFAWVGHSHAEGFRWSIPLVAAHLLAAAFWLGAFEPLRLMTRGDDAGRVAAAAARFGRIALAVVGLLILAGAIVLGLLLGSLPELWRSDYGRTAALKLSLAAAILVFAGLNKLRLTPRLAAGDGGAARALRRSIAAEMTLASGVLIATAALTTLSGPPAAS